VVQILARHAATAGISLVAGLIAAGQHRIDLVPVLHQRALEIIGSAMFSLEMKIWAGDAPADIALRGIPWALDFVFPLQIPTPYDLLRRRFRQRWIALVGEIIAQRRSNRDEGAGETFLICLSLASASVAPMRSNLPIRSPRLSSPATKLPPLLCVGRSI